PGKDFSHHPAAGLCRANKSTANLSVGNPFGVVSNTGPGKQSAYHASNAALFRSCDLVGNANGAVPPRSVASFSACQRVSVFYAECGSQQRVEYAASGSFSVYLCHAGI